MPNSELDTNLGHCFLRSNFHYPCRVCTNFPCNTPSSSLNQTRGTTQYLVQVCWEIETINAGYLKRPGLVIPYRNRGALQSRHRFNVWSWFRWTHSIFTVLLFVHPQSRRSALPKSFIALADASHRLVSWLLTRRLTWRSQHMIQMVLMHRQWLAIFSSFAITSTELIAMLSY